MNNKILSSTGIRVVAEVANCHSGELSYIERLVDEVAEGAFSYIKFQIYTAEELLHPQHRRYVHFKSQVLHFDDWKALISRSNSLGLVPLVDIYGFESLEMAIDLGIRNLKIPSTNRNLSIRFVESLSRMDLDEVYFSVTSLTFYEISKYIKTLQENLKPSTAITLIHGHQEFPTPIENTNVAHIKRLKDKFGTAVNVGFADHTDPRNNGIADACLLAVGAGANYLEKHVSLEREITKVDFQSSIEPHQFKSFIEKIDRAMSLMTPNVDLEKQGIENYLEKMRKIPVAKRELSQGRTLSEDDFDYLRFENPVGNLTRIRGGEVICTTITKEAPVKFEDLSHRVVAVVVCRSDSKRLPNKALRPIAGTTPILHLLNRLKRTRYIDEIVLATTDRAEDSDLCRIVESQGFLVYRGSNVDVLGRMLNSAQQFQPHHIIRITGDDILISVDDLTNAIKEHVMTESHYTNMLSIPSGTEAEIFDYEFIRDLYKSRETEWDTEYLTNCLNEISILEFRTHCYSSSKFRNKAWRLTLDTEEDWGVLNDLFVQFQEEGILETYNLDDVIRVVESNEEMLRRVKSKAQRNHTYPQSTKYLRWVLT